MLSRLPRAAPCIVMKNRLVKLAQECQSHLLLVFVDIDAQTALASQLGIESIATTRLYQDGEVVETIRGPGTEKHCAQGSGGACFPAGAAGSRRSAQSQSVGRHRKGAGAAGTGGDRTTGKSTVSYRPGETADAGAALPAGARVASRPCPGNWCSRRRSK